MTSLSSNQARQTRSYLVFAIVAVASFVFWGVELRLSMASHEERKQEVLVAYQKRKQEEIVHPFLKEKIPFGLIPHVQAMLLARHLRGDLDAYPPFFWS